MTVSHDCNLNGLDYEIRRKDHIEVNILVKLAIGDDFLPPKQMDDTLATWKMQAEKMIVK